ncbi:Proteasome subunit alpha type-6 [Paramarasmius palmivorus]|uniref:Proteasome subunit alpha type-6 n=1 Tax=Paramarasmius palmivorus TaxID=297713 RepID=A0AAW0BDN2_9AGAR
MNKDTFLPPQSPIPQPHPQYLYPLAPPSQWPQSQHSSQPTPPNPVNNAALWANYGYGSQWPQQQHRQEPYTPHQPSIYPLHHARHPYTHPSPHPPTQPPLPSPDSNRTPSPQEQQSLKKPRFELFPKNVNDYPCGGSNRVPPSDGGHSGLGKRGRRGGSFGGVRRWGGSANNITRGGGRSGREGGFRGRTNTTQAPMRSKSISFGRGKGAKHHCYDIESRRLGYANTFTSHTVDRIAPRQGHRQEGQILNAESKSCDAAPDQPSVQGRRATFTDFKIAGLEIRELEWRSCPLGVSSVQYPPTSVATEEDESRYETSTPFPTTTPKATKTEHDDNSTPIPIHSDPNNPFLCLSGSSTVPEFNLSQSRIRIYFHTPIQSCPSTGSIDSARKRKRKKCDTDWDEDEGQRSRGEQQRPVHIGNEPEHQSSVPGDDETPLHSSETPSASERDWRMVNISGYRDFQPTSEIVGCCGAPAQSDSHNPIQQESQKTTKGMGRGVFQDPQEHGASMSSASSTHMETILLTPSPAITRNLRTPSPNRLSISYSGDDRRLVIDAEVVDTMRIFRKEGRIEIRIRARSGNSEDTGDAYIDGISMEAPSNVYQPIAVDCEGSLEPIFPPFTRAFLQRYFTLVVYLSQERPLSEAKWTKSGDIREWLRSVFGRVQSTADIESSWEGKIIVVDPDPPPTIKTVLENWALHSSVGDGLNDRQKFIRTRLGTSDNQLEILLRLVRGERATAFQHSSTSISRSSIEGPLLKAWEDGAEEHKERQTHVSLAVMAIFQVAVEFAEKAEANMSTETGESSRIWKGKKEVEDRVGEIIRCLPARINHKSLDGMFKEWKAMQKVEGG